MRGFRAKALMKVVRWERAAELKVVERDLVIDKRGIVRNSPDSIRAMYRKVKAAFLEAVRFVGQRVHFDRGLSEQAYERYVKRLAGKPGRKSGRKAAATGGVPQKFGDVALIDSPLRVIAEHCPPAKQMGRDELGRPAMEYIPHPTLVKARRMANAGNGAGVRRIAREILQAV